jgi:hypothetical protein
LDNQTAKSGDLVQIHIMVLDPTERSKNLPEETKKVPYEGWVKGFLVDKEAAIGDLVTISTLIGREIQGKLDSINPKYQHDFGEPQPELLMIGKTARLQLAEWRRGSSL